MAANDGDEDGWIRDDDSANDERRRWGNYLDSQPVWNFKANIEASPDSQPTEFFFEVCKSWFNMEFLTEMADKMQAVGRAKGTQWAGWKVDVNDLLQWIGVWYYFLAFPQRGERRAYFAGPSSRRFGPRHMIEECG